MTRRVRSRVQSNEVQSVSIFSDSLSCSQKLTNFELIQRAAAVLYGDRQTAMAHDLGVTTRTVYRWLHGRATPALKIFVTLLERLHTRLDELDSLGATIKEYLDGNGERLEDAFRIPKGSTVNDSHTSELSKP